MICQKKSLYHWFCFLDSSFPLHQKSCRKPVSGYISSLTNKLWIKLLIKRTVSRIFSGTAFKAMSSNSSHSQSISFDAADSILYRLSKTETLPVNLSCASVHTVKHPCIHWFTHTHTYTHIHTTNSLGVSKRKYVKGSCSKIICPKLMWV